MSALQKIIDNSIDNKITPLREIEQAAAELAALRKAGRRWRKS